ncbi:MAG: phage tail tape measure protein [Rhodobiaceae bacterium]|nr:phage tail tape measure protein [Rhodobiaceae bacterium]
MEFESFDVAGLSSGLRGIRAEFDAATNASGRLGKEAKNAFSGISREGQRASRTGQDLHRALGTAFDDLVVGGRSLQDVLKSLAVDLAKLAAQDIFGTGIGGTQPGTGGSVLGDLFGSILTPNAKGNAFAQGHIQAFAKGGVLSNPALFPLSNGVGLAGEAGPEAILPLARGADGKLGVASQDKTQALTITFNVTATDAASFKRSESQIAAMLQRTVSRGNRNL